MKNEKLVSKKAIYKHTILYIIPVILSLLISLKKYLYFD